MKKKSKFLPYDCYETIYQIDYDKLKEENKSILVFDLDNTIMPYHCNKPTEKCFEFFQSLKLRGFTPIIVSNNHKKRINYVGEYLHIDTISNAKKPFKVAYKKLFSKYPNYQPCDFVAIGDQIITDVWGANKVNVDCILVKPIYMDNEHWYTKINRMFERKIIRGFKKKHTGMYVKIKNARGEKLEL